MTRWRDWARRRLWPPPRHHAPALTELRFGYERVGVTLYDRPIPWSAEAVVVEAAFRLPPTAPRRREDFALALPGAAPLPPGQVRRADGEATYRALFRLPPPGRSARAELRYRNVPFAWLTLPHVGREQVLEQVRLDSPTLFARIGGQTIACRALAAGQCEALTASALLACPAGLLPAADLDLQVEFRRERDGAAERVPVRLTASQLAAPSALVTVAPRRLPRRPGPWTISWLAGPRVLAWQQMRVLSPRELRQSLRVADAAFVVQSGQGPPRVSRQLPPPGGADRAGPCFFVSSAEPGMAALCRFRVTALGPGAARTPLLLKQQVLLGDGPTPVAPGTLDPADLAQLTAFELSSAGRAFGSLPLGSVPAASFTSEGGFAPPPDFPWGAAAEEEIKDRLGRLLEGPPEAPATSPAPPPP